MQIKRLRIAGFKSFVDPAELRIEPGLTGVVGPNGCGKSNLLEALRWTMGETSARSMRGAGMDDVIFAGTATRPPRDFAEVSILAEVAGEETEIVRRIERGAGSAYRIDGRDVRARDVGLVFADAATGAHSPALVSQGRIGAVIAARPADRRAMLEEAAGIAGLHVRRRDAEARLRATEANLQRLDEVVADQAARTTQLKRQARAAERYRLLSGQIRTAEARMIFARWREAAAAADAAREQAVAAEARVATAAEAERLAAAARESVLAAAARARAAAQGARDAAAEQGHALATLRGDRAAAARRIADLAEQRRRIVDDRAREGALAHDAAQALALLSAEGKALEARVADAAAAMPKVDAALAEAERRARDAEVALAQALAVQAGETAETRVAAAALAAARTRADRADRERDAAAAALRALGEAEPIDRTRAAAAAARAEAGERGDAAAAAHAAADARHRAATIGRDAADAARATARAELAAVDAEAAALRRATEPRGRERVLDRIAARPGYERALAGALGDELDTAPAAWAGATALPGDPAGPAGATALADLVDAPAELARRLAQVFVAEEDRGQPLAVGQRLVTLAGALRRWDGFRAVGSGAAAAERLERIARLRVLEAARGPAAAALAAAEAACAAVEATIADARGAAADARAAMTRAEAAAREAQLREDRAAAALERHAGQRADGDARAARIAAEAAEAGAERARAEAAAAALPDGRASADAVALRGEQAGERRATAAQLRGERAAIDRAAAAGRERQAAVAAEGRGWRARAGEAAGRIADMDRHETQLARDADALAALPATLDARIAQGAQAEAVARAAADASQADERAADAAVHAAQAAQAATTEALAAAREARAGAAARLEGQELRRVEMGRVSGERFGCPAPVLPERLGFAPADVGAPAGEAAAHERLSADRERIGPVNLVAERELAELEAAAAGNAAERAELGHAVARLRGSIGTLNREGRQRLLAAFEAVDGHFRRLFTTLFDGGSAHLELVDSDDPLEAGLEIMAQPPGKRLQSLTLLSGGEQALTAVALIFGLFLTNPAPICVLDEVDAPLDDANIDRFCSLLDRMAAETATRYLIVTHNAVTMSRMHRLFGVTMIERGVSRLVSVDLRAAEGLVAAE